MIRFPGCKINIGLNITGKRDDGFHNLESIFFPVPFTDILEMVKSDRLHFTCTGRAIPGSTEDNIVLNAYYLLRERYPVTPVKIHLHKQVPMGAGLGGGSADGAAALMLLNDLFDLKISANYLASMADELGSDCAFFIKNQPAFVSGKGENVAEIPLSLKGKFLKIINPGIHISTKEAFKDITFSAPSQLNQISTLPVNEWKLVIKNDFEKSIFPVYPEIKEIKDLCYENGAVYSSMTGTGSSVYGIFNEPIGQITSHFEWQIML